MSSDTILMINNLHVSFGKVQILKDASIRVGAGEIVSIVGSNGAGKTTMLNTISRFVLHKSGSIFFSDVCLDRVPYPAVVQMGLIHVPEGRMVIPSLTVKENLDLGAFHGEARRRRENSLKDVYRIFPILEKRKNQAAGTLSGGEQQMLAIGRGLMSLPKLLMLDEPSLGLAPIVIKHMFEVIKEINARGTAILLVEQNVRKALSISTRGYVMENGEISMEGTGNELLQNKRMQKAFLGL